MLGSFHQEPAVCSSPGVGLSCHRVDRGAQREPEWLSFGGRDGRSKQHHSARSAVPQPPGMDAGWVSRAWGSYSAGALWAPLASRAGRAHTAALKAPPKAWPWRDRRRRGHRPVRWGGVCVPGPPRCRQQVEYCRCGRLKCRRHNGGLCPIRHARAPLWKAHTRGDRALAPAIIPAA